MEILKKLVDIESIVHAVYLKIREIRKETEKEAKVREEKKKKFVIIDGGRKD